MSARYEIQKIRDETLLELNYAHNYFSDTKNAWQTIVQYVQQEGVKFSWHNRVTNTTANEIELVTRSQKYVDIELASATLQQFVSIFESFLHDVIRVWLIAYPGRLSSRQLSGKDVLRLADKAAMLDELIERELREVFYDRPVNWFDYLKQLTKIHSPEIAQIQQFAEIKATRDILVHGRGIVNAYYLEKAGDLSRSQPGQPLVIPEPYHQESWELVCLLVRNIGDQMAERVH